MKYFQKILNNLFIIPSFLKQEFGSFRKFIKPLENTTIYTVIISTHDTDKNYILTSVFLLF